MCFFKLCLLQDNARRALAALGHEPLDPPYPLFLQLHALLERGMAQELLNMQIPEPHQKLTDPFRIWAHFLLKQFDAGKALLEKYPREAMEKPQSPFFFLQGCYFAKTNGFEAALKHFKQMPDYTYPPLYALLGHSLKNTNLQPDLFLWEEAELLRQKILFSHCLGKRGNVLICERKLKKTGVYSKLSLHGTIV